MPLRRLLALVYGRRPPACSADYVKVFVVAVTLALCAAAAPDRAAAHLTGCDEVVGYTDGCGSIDGFPETVNAGEEVTFSVTINGGDCVDDSTGPAFGYPRLVGSYIDRFSVLIDGAPPSRTFADGIFHYPFVSCSEGNPPRLDPVNGSDPGVALPLSGTHTITLKMQSFAPAECIHLVDDGPCEPDALGPWIAIVGWNPDRSPQAWTHAQPFTITRRQATQVSYFAVTDQFGEAYRGEQIQYILSATADPLNDSLVLEAEIPEGTDLVPGSIDNGGQVVDDLVRWEFSNTSSKTVSFEVIVRSPAEFPEEQTTIDSTGRAISDIDDVSRPLSLLVSTNPRLSATATYELFYDPAVGGAREVELESDDGKLEGEIIAGDEITYRGEDWDPEGGPIVIELEGDEIDRHDPAATFEGTFTMPHYPTFPLGSPSGNCKVELVASQDDATAELDVMGEIMGLVQVVENVTDPLDIPLAVDDALCTGSPPVLPAGGEAVVLADNAFTDPKTHGERFADWNGQWLGVVTGGQRVEARGGVLANTIVVGSRTLNRVPGDQLAFSPGIFPEAANGGAFDAAPFITDPGTLGTHLRQISPGRVAFVRGAFDSMVAGNVVFMGEGSCQGAGGFTPFLAVDGTVLLLDSLVGAGTVLGRTIWFNGDGDLDPCPLFAGGTPGSGLAGSLSAEVIVVRAFPGADRLRQSASAGSDSLDVGQPESFAPGDDVIVDPGSPTEEHGTVSDVGSSGARVAATLTLATPLAHDHGTGTLVVNATRPPPGYLPSLADPKQGKAAEKCAKAIFKGGATFVANKLKALDGCVAAVLTCVETKPDDGACLTKAEGKCTKQLGKVAKAETKLTDTIIKKCGALGADAMTDVDGLGFAQLAVACDEVGVTLTDTASIAVCLVAHHECAVERLYGTQVPRAGALLRLVDSSLGPPSCLEDRGGDSENVGDPAVGKALGKCAKSLAKAGQKLAKGELKLLAQCAVKMFSCAQKKPDDVACIAKARATCQKALGKRDAAVAKALKALAKKCGGIPFGTLASATGLDVDDLAPTCADVGVGSVADIEDYELCLAREHVCTSEALMRLELPRFAEMLSIAGAQAGSAFCSD